MLAVETKFVMNSVIKIVIVLLLVLAYSILRYIILGDVRIDHLPAFIVNKASAFASVIFLCLFMNSLRAGDNNGRFYWGKAFFHLTIIHTGLSLSLLSPEYFSAFYNAEKLRLSLWGELAILVGVIGLYISVTCTQYASVKLRHRCYQGVLILAGLHLVFMGGAGWFKPADWHGGLPPITLLSFVIVNIGLLFSVLESPQPSKGALCSK